MKALGPNASNSYGMMQLAVAGTFTLSAIAISTVLYLAIGFGVLGAMLGGVILALIPSGLLGRRIARNEAKAAQQYQSDIRANREAEKQKQIDAMLRKASNVPNVKR